MSIEFKEGAVCFAGGKYWYAINDNHKLLVDDSAVSVDIETLIKSPDFQLNTIKQGDYIEASEFDTEQKYNGAVDVFKLFSFKFENNNARVTSFEYMITPSSKYLGIEPDGFIFSYQSNINDNARKLTYQQIMAIGELKRLELERSAPKITPDLTPDVKEDEWTDRHYSSFYQLNKDDIKEGQIKIDAYFVNRMWKINQWDDTGAAFHVLKTLPRIANNKNPLKRELVALKKQVDLLCKMHGVNDENTN
ncbi:ATPase [Pseudoalteromonas phage vB_PspS-H40/1]|uniref:ATPase n=1 Tax=Pseudoalteromonas phage vB_PspS-H40/1 TaxID=1856120 RepID=UPI0007DD6E9F|nr:ATPase [Pseudoalteromonas phage vB_PspS-H40/1]ANI22062.1 hypothetical protein H401_45 [Pseudoalteromonas phage vB_PspS-H40/1]